jgi:hypothetical protein
VVAHDLVVLASFENRHAAEHTLALLGRGFRKEARKGHVTVLVITGNQDGSLTLTQSRVLTAGGFGYTLARISLSVTIGFTGIISTLKGAKGAAREVRTRRSGVGMDEQAVHALLARVGPNAALVLVSCDDQQIRQAVVAQSVTRASEGWDGSRSELLAGLDPGPQDDWLRAALDS